MLIRIGFDIAFTAQQPMPMLAMLSVHPSRVAGPGRARESSLRDPPAPIYYYHDSFGNFCGRLVPPQGRRDCLRNRVIVRDSGLPDPVAPDARQIPVAELPDDVIQFLLASRYCETDRLGDAAWELFGKTPPGWARVQAICDYVHDHIDVRLPARPADQDRLGRLSTSARGVCRDFAHLAITFCRCMNIPARYCTGYLGDIGVPPDHARWISAPGSRSIWAAAGTPSTPATTRPGSAASSWPGAATPPTSPSPPASGSATLTPFDVHTDEVAEAPPP